MTNFSSKPERLLKSGEFAELCGTTKETILHFARMGVLLPYRTERNPEFADLFYAYGVLDSGRFIGESSHLVGLGSNQASFYLRA